MLPKYRDGDIIYIQKEHDGLLEPHDFGLAYGATHGAMLSELATISIVERAQHEAGTEVQVIRAMRAHVHSSCGTSSRSLSSP